MSTRKILFATDFSLASTRALHVASSLARDTGDALLIVHVCETQTHSGGELPDEGFQASDADLSKLHAVVPTGPKISCEYRLLYGQPANTIVELATREDVDAIVLSTHGDSRVHHLQTGSVAQAVMRDAHCAVIAYKPPTHVPPAESMHSA